MSMNFTAQVLPFYSTNVGNDANYESPGNFGLDSAEITGAPAQKLLTLVEVLRSLIAETTSTNQLRDIHEVLRKMMATMKFGGPLTYSASEFATNAQKAALNYIAKNPTHSPQPLIQGYGIGYVEPPEDLT